MNQLAYSYEQAAAMCGVSKSLFLKLVASGDVTPSYMRTKPLITHEELQRFIDSLPHEPKR